MLREERVREDVAGPAPGGDASARRHAPGASPAVPEAEATVPMRPGEELDPEVVRRFLREHVPGFPDRPLQIRQFPTGASNLTYLLRAGEWVAVLRRPPFGPLPPKGHDMGREAAILQRLHPVFPLAPRPLAFCADESVLGAPFYVMEYRPGVVLDDAFPAGVDTTPQRCRHLSYLVVDTLADLHAVDYREAGLEGFGHPEGFLQRQVEGWMRRWERAKTEEILALDPLRRWLQDRIPPSPAPAIIHNDFKLNNLLLSPDLVRVVAVLDWEMATLGDPLFDLGVSLSYWVTPSDPDVLRNGLPTVTTRPGFISREEFVERYARRTGRDVEGIGWYLTFAYFKLAVILQQIYVRWREGKSRDPRFGRFGKIARDLILYAAERADRGARL